MRYLLILLLFTTLSYAFDFTPPLGLLDEGKISFLTESVAVDGVVDKNINYDMSFLYAITCQDILDNGYKIRLELDNLDLSPMLDCSFIMDKTGKIISDIEWSGFMSDKSKFLIYMMKYAALSFTPSDNRKWERIFNFPAKMDNASVFIGNWKLKEITPNGSFRIINEISMWIPPEYAKLFFQQEVENCNLRMESEYIVDTCYPRIVSDSFYIHMNVKLDGRQYSIWWLGESKSTYS